ncbi:alpha/beta hydrolase [Endozoicomonas sp. OPT23]|uniref:alpha/beta hydrolase n=1 Tax=Endozoicomonas sp. OPT23 TaxID=2072845 RepID=UPI00129BA9CF|nr:alpha/beta hydrolase [Endozoicomonas sp. OPT23]MRI31527.1 alpha/beta hydrolase [Endozoicomonas sp. OPT23]
MTHHIGQASAYRPDPKSLKALLEILDTASLNSTVSTSGMFNDYFKFYGIDFEHQMSEVRHVIGRIDSHDYQLACHLFLKDNARGSVFLLHGYYDHVGLFSNLIRFLLENDYNVVAYELPGHGLSSGAPASIPDFGIYTEILTDIFARFEESLPKPWHAFGQSTGCAILTDYLAGLAETEQTGPFEKVFFSAPLIRPWLWKLGRVQLRILKPFTKGIRRRYTDNSRNREFLELAHNDPLGPDVLPTEWVSSLDRWIKRIESSSFRSSVSPVIFQGTQDRTVDAAHNIPVLQRLFSNPEVHYQSEAGHHLMNELPKTVCSIQKILKTHLLNNDSSN